MEEPGFFVIDGLYDELLSRAYLYIRPMEAKTCFTVSASIFKQKEFRGLIEKVIIVNLIEDDLASVRPASTQIKSCRFSDPRDGRMLWGSESKLILIDKYID